MTRPSKKMRTKIFVIQQLNFYGIFLRGPFSHMHKDIYIYKVAHNGIPYNRKNLDTISLSPVEYTKFSFFIQ